MTRSHPFLVWWEAYERLMLDAESPRANTASVIPVSGTPSPSASIAVQVPVPFVAQRSLARDGPITASRPFAARWP